MPVGTGPSVTDTVAVSVAVAPVASFPLHGWPVAPSLRTVAVVGLRGSAAEPLPLANGTLAISAMPAAAPTATRRCVSEPSAGMKPVSPPGRQGSPYLGPLGDYVALTNGRVMKRRIQLRS